jgi:hypothetical protein
MLTASFLSSFMERFVRQSQTMLPSMHAFHPNRRRIFGVRVVQLIVPREGEGIIADPQGDVRLVEAVTRGKVVVQGRVVGLEGWIV